MPKEVVPDFAVLRLMKNSVKSELFSEKSKDMTSLISQKKFVCSSSQTSKPGF